MRAAIAMDVVGVPSTVSVVEADQVLRSQLPSSVTLLAAGDSQALPPHVIVQFPAGASVDLADGRLRTEHPNRIIVTNDPPNEVVTLAPALPAAARAARVLLLSSLNAIQDEEILRSRLAELSDLVRSLPATTTVMWEDAGYHRPQLRHEVSDVMSRLAGIYSMNEDELAEFIGHPTDLLDAGEVARSLEELRQRVPAPTIVVHSKYWALAYGFESAGLRGALRGGIAMASARYLHGDGLTADHFYERAGAAPAAVARQAAAALEALVPDLVCEPALDMPIEAPTTIGLGDTFVGGFLAALTGRVLS